MSYAIIILPTSFSNATTQTPPSLFLTAPTFLSSAPNLPVPTDSIYTVTDFKG